MKLFIHLIIEFIRFIRLIIRLKFTAKFKNTFKSKIKSKIWRWQFASQATWKLMRLLTDDLVTIYQWKGMKDKVHMSFTHMINRMKLIIMQKDVARLSTGFNSL